MLHYLRKQTSFIRRACTGKVTGPVLSDSFLCFLIFGGFENVQPKQQHPLPSYLDYKSNSSIKSYQTSYFPSQCTQGPESSNSFEISVGTGMDFLGGTCDHTDPEISRDLNQFCDGPLNPKTAYRY